MSSQQLIVLCSRSDQYLLCLYESQGCLPFRNMGYPTNIWGLRCVSWYPPYITLITCRKYQPATLMQRSTKHGTYLSLCEDLRANTGLLTTHIQLQNLNPLIWPHKCECVFSGYNYCVQCGRMCGYSTWKPDDVFCGSSVNWVGAFMRVWGLLFTVNLHYCTHTHTWFTSLGDAVRQVCCLGHVAHRRL